MNRRILTILSTILCTALLLSTAACKQTNQELDPKKEAIVFAVVAPLSGTLEEEGRRMVAGAQLAAEEINSAGGILSRAVEIREFDSEDTPEKAAKIAEELVATENVLAVIGDYTANTSRAAARTYSDGELIQYSPSTNDAHWLAVSDYQFTASASRPGGVSDLARFVLKEKLDVQNVAVIEIRKSDISLTAKEFYDGLAETGINFAASNTLGMSDDAPGIASYLLSTGVESVAIIGKEGDGDVAVAAINALRAEGVEVPICLAPALSEEEELSALVDSQNIYTLDSANKKVSTHAQEIKVGIENSIGLEDTGVGVAAFRAVKNLADAGNTLEEEVTRSTLAAALRTLLGGNGTVSEAEGGTKSEQKVVELKNGKWK